MNGGILSKEHTFDLDAFIWYRLYKSLSAENKIISIFRSENTRYYSLKK